ncbi:hypothetical protein SDC9_145544 [bioreactor metagenome]|uniref:Uncharacterized protein n=1 Tax=bioreactor metagenome TaxID=1076179 RepID=A0A645EB53_9ZZZZ
MKKGQWLIGAGVIGILATLSGGIIGPLSLGLPFDAAVAFASIVPELTAGAILILVGL